MKLKVSWRYKSSGTSTIEAASEKTADVERAIQNQLPDILGDTHHEDIEVIEAVQVAEATKRRYKTA